MREPTKKYITSVIEQIRCKKVRKNISDELLNHIMEQKQDYIDCGMSDDEAEEKAVIDMGDPVDVGVNFDKIHRPKPQWSLIFGVLALMIIGVLIQLFCYSGITDHYIYGNSYGTYHTYNMILGCVVGLVCMFVIYFIDYTVIFKKPVILYIALIALVVIYTLVLDINYINGRYVGIIPEALIITVPIVGSIVYSMKNKGVMGMIKFIFMSLIIFICFAMINNLSNGFFACWGLFFILIAICKDNWFCLKKYEKVAFVLYLIIVSFFIIKIMLDSPYRMARFEAIFDYESDKYGFGYNIFVTKSILSSCVMFGQGNPVMLDGNIVDINNYFPLIEDGKEFLMFMYRFGKIPALILAILIFTFLIKIVIRSFREKNKMGRFIAVSISGIFFGKIIFYFMDNLGFYFVQSFIPFMGYGKNFMVINGILMGILLSVFRNTDVVFEKNIFKERIYKNFDFSKAWDFISCKDVDEEQFIEDSESKEIYNKGYDDGYTDASYKLDSYRNRFITYVDGMIIINLKKRE